jgi:hypothetical protein
VYHSPPSSAAMLRATVLSPGTELQYLRILLENRNVARYEVVDVTRLKHLVPTRTFQTDPPLEDVAPMRRLVHVRRQTSEQRCRVDTLRKYLIGHDHAAPLDLTTAETLAVILYQRHITQLTAHTSSFLVNERVGSSV